MNTEWRNEDGSITYVSEMSVGKSFRREIQCTLPSGSRYYKIETTSAEGFILRESLEDSQSKRFALAVFSKGESCLTRFHVNDERGERGEEQVIDTSRDGERKVEVRYYPS